jgi:hypothetical protein
MKFGCRAGIHAATATDRMHVVKGLIANMVHVLDKLIAAEAGDSQAASYLTTIHARMDSRFAIMPPLMTPEVYLPTFSTGFYSKNQLEAWHYTAWLSLIPFVIGEDDHIIKDEGTRATFVTCCLLMMKFVYPMWCKVEISEREVVQLDVDIIRWRSHFHQHYNQYLKTRCDHQNFHYITHVPDDIRRNGVCGNFCTSTWEQAHVIMAINPSKFCNNKNVRNTI